MLYPGAQPHGLLNHGRTPLSIAAPASRIRAAGQHEYPVATFRFRDGPDDLRVLLLQLVEDWWPAGRHPNEIPAVVRRAESFPFTVFRLPLARLPETVFDEVGGVAGDDRSESHAQAMVGRRVPPVLVANGRLIDGKHRAYAARLAGLDAVAAIDLGESSELAAIIPTDPGDPWTLHTSPGVTSGTDPALYDRIHTYLHRGVRRYVEVTAAPLLREDPDWRTPSPSSGDDPLAAADSVHALLSRLPLRTRVACAAIAAELVVPVYEALTPATLEALNALFLDSYPTGRIPSAPLTALRVAMMWLAGDLRDDASSLLRRARRAASQVVRDLSEAVRRLGAHAEEGMVRPTRAAEACADVALAAYNAVTGSPEEATFAASYAVALASRAWPAPAHRAEDDTHREFLRRWWSTCRRRLAVQDIATAVIETDAAPRITGARRRRGKNAPALTPYDQLFARLHRGSPRSGERAYDIIDELLATEPRPLQQNDPLDAFVLDITRIEPPVGGVSQTAVRYYYNENWAWLFEQIGTLAAARFNAVCVALMYPVILEQPESMRVWARLLVQTVWRTLAVLDFAGLRSRRVDAAEPVTGPHATMRERYSYEHSQAEEDLRIELDRLLDLQDATPPGPPIELHNADVPPAVRLARLAYVQLANSTRSVVLSGRPDIYGWMIASFAHTVHRGPAELRRRRTDVTGWGYTMRIIEQPSTGAFIRRAWGVYRRFVGV